MFCPDNDERPDLVSFLDDREAQHQHNAAFIDDIQDNYDANHAAYIREINDLR